MSLRSRLTRLAVAHDKQPPPDVLGQPRVEVSPHTLHARIWEIVTAASQPEARPHLREVGRCLAMMFVERDADKWLGNLRELGSDPDPDPEEVPRLCQLAARREYEQQFGKTYSGSLL